MLNVFLWRAQGYLYLVYVVPSTKMWNAQVCVINSLIFESACRRMGWIFRQESGCFDLSVSRLRFLIHSRIKVQTMVHQPEPRRWRWRRKAEKQNRICMHRSVPEYKQRIIKGHKVTVSCYVAWRRVWVRGARGDESLDGVAGARWDFVPLALTLASSEPVLLTSKGAPSLVFSFQQPPRRGKFQFIRGRPAPTSQWNTYISASLLRHSYPPANGLQVGKLIPGTLFH